MALETYNRKRRFSATPEPKGTQPTSNKRSQQLRFVVQEHHARRLHFDLRLEMGGVLKSWAVPKGPSLNPADKRLAVHTEDHPLKYIDFEGHIPEGNYGAGDMAVWDHGTYTVLNGDPEKAEAAGKLEIQLEGEKLHGEFHLFRLREEDQWLLIKSRDEFADPEWTLENVIEDGGPVRKNQKALAPESAPKNGIPEQVTPMLATLVDGLPTGGNWFYEVKWDGYRAVTFLDHGQIRLVSRNHNDLTPLFPDVADAFRTLGVKDAVIDGEVVALDEHGSPSFQLLQNSTNIRYGVRGPRKRNPGGPTGQLVYYAFDLLHLDGRDLTKLPLRERKQLLETLLSGRGGDKIHYSAHFEGAAAGKDLLATARKEGLEGIMAKDPDSRYMSRRSDRWLKIKLHRQMDVVIGGYTSPRGARKGFGALLLGYYEDGKLQYIGHTGTGFDNATLNSTFDLMQPLRVEKSPFASKVDTNETPHWIKPVLVCEVKYGEITSDLRLRHPVFLGLRRDKDPKECRLELAEEASGIEEATKSEKKEKPSKSKKSSTKPETSAPDADVLSKEDLTGDLKVSADGYEVSLTHLDKVYFPEDGYTKGDLLRFYYQMAPALLPYLKDHPVILKRYPNGIGHKPFFQHNVPNPPPFVTSFIDDEGEETVHYAVCNNLATLLYIVNLGTVTQNPWASTTRSKDKPEWMIFDLDPGDKVEFNSVCELALALHEVLEQIKLEGYAKTSGASGMHVYLPLGGLYNYEQVRDFGMLIASVIIARRPDLATVERSLSKRSRDLIYFDVLQNREGATVAAPWSVRARTGAPVSTPLTWEEVAAKPTPGQHTIANVPARFKRVGDYFSPVLSHPQRIEAALPLLEELLASAPAPKKRSTRKKS